MIKEYLLQNWAMLLVLVAFIISLKETIFLERKTIRRMYILILTIFLLSVVVFTEFYLADLGTYPTARMILMAIRYSTTPFIIATVICTLAKGLRWYIYIPAIVLAVIDFISVFNGMVFYVSADNTFTRGPLGYLPFGFVGAYCIFMIYILVKRSNKQRMEIIPIVFLGAAFASGLILPFVYGKDYSQLFCSTLAIALYVYYVFTMLMLTKKDALTGLLNRQAYYSGIERNSENITALVSIDMNGLKTINDNNGHEAGDKALTTLASCFMKAAGSRQQCFRIGGDEFVIVCRHTSKSEVVQLAELIKESVEKTEYSCAVGYSHIDDGAGSIDDLLKRSDDMMYEEKSRYYADSGIDRRRQNVNEKEQKKRG